MKKSRKILAAVLAAVMVCSAVPVSADASDTYVSLGADLSVEQRAEVLELMDLTEDDLAGMDVVQITNEKEHEVLGGYLSSSIIGTRAISCVRVDKKKKDGINVEVKNITYCTEGMYQNALITAGIENAEVIVAAPVPVSGTAGLVGIMEAYQELTGEAIPAANQDAAVNEIVATGELAENIGSAEDAENLMALIKQEIAASGITGSEDILRIIEEAAQQIGVSLTEEEKAQILSLMEKIGQLDLDVDTLKKQASDIYNRLKDLGVDMSGLDKDTVVSGLSKIFAEILEFFKNLFA